MSRIGKKPVVIPAQVQVTFQDRLLKASGPKGELELPIPIGIDFSIENQVLTFSRNTDDRKVRSLHGLTRALTQNVIDGVSVGFSRLLQIEGVGYKAEMRGTRLLLAMGFSHPVVIIPPDGINFVVEGNNKIRIFGIDKELLGQVAAKIRSIRPPEPYKGKGIRYEGEYVRRKAGKTSSK
ncbi:MAG: large subunit ribosomal protein [Bacteroidota bacterium]|nr:large subunit ribosomal protein [Bacteroidota bacterium]